MKYKLQGSLRKRREHRVKGIEHGVKGMEHDAWSDFFVAVVFLRSVSIFCGKEEES
jgi:hypothetical protein